MQHPLQTINEVDAMRQLFEASIFGKSISKRRQVFR